MAPKRETALDAWGRELAHSCEAAGMTGRQLAEALHFAPATVSQWMNGKRTPRLKDVERCDEVLGTNGYLARYFRKWVNRELPAEWTDKWLWAEAHANVVQNYDLFVIPGLLQTEDYARAVLRHNRRLSVDPEEWVRRRIERQSILDDENPPMCIFVLDEYAIRRTAGGSKIMLDQMARLCELATRPNIVIKIVPWGTEYYAGCPFMILRLDGAEIVHLDDVLAGRIVDEKEQTVMITKIWEDIREVALPPRESLDLIEKAMQAWNA